MTQEPRQPASDLVGDVQRWLLRTSARGVSRGLNDQIRTALRGGGHGDVWETATADEEPPECAWCPICRARRRLWESGPGLASHVAAATDAVGVVMQDAVSAFEAAVAAAAGPAAVRATGGRRGVGRGHRRARLAVARGAAAVTGPGSARGRRPGRRPGRAGDISQPGRARAAGWPGGAGTAGAGTAGQFR